MTCPHCGEPIPADTTSCSFCATDVNIAATRSEISRPRRPAWLVFGGAAAGVLALGLAAMAVLDPSPPAGMQFADRFPADADAYVEVDVEALMSDDTRTVVEAFSSLVEAKTGEPFEIETLLDEALGSLTSDLGKVDFDAVATWATGPVGIGIFAEPEAMAMIVGGEDAQALDDFIADLVAAADEPTSSGAGGITLWDLRPDASRQGLVVGRQGDDLLLASDIAVARRLVAPEGDTVATLPRFGEAISQLPTQAILVYVVNGDVPASFALLGSMVGDADGGLTVGSLAITGGNLRLDHVTERGEGPAPGYDPALTASVPAETIAFFRVGAYVHRYAALLSSPELEDFDAHLQDETGFRLEELVAPFSVDGALAVWPSSHFLLPGNVLLVGVSDRDQSDFPDKVAALADSMGFQLSPSDEGYSYGGLIHLGARDRLAFLTTDRSLIRDEPVSSFADGDLYERATALIQGESGDGELVVAVDLPALADMMAGVATARDPEAADLLECLPLGVAAGSSQTGDDFVSTFVLIEVARRC